MKDSFHGYDRCPRYDDLLTSPSLSLVVGFLRSGWLPARGVRKGILESAGIDDVWKVGGSHVADVQELASEKWDPWKGNRGKLETHRGHFFWSGADTFIGREIGARALVAYLNRIHEIAPVEPLRLIAHSHGCNVLKLASFDRRLSTRIWFEKVAFLACPHFAARAGKGSIYHYQLSAKRFGAILNLFSSRDSVQVDIAEKLAGPPGFRITDYYPPEAYRVEQDPRARAVYEDHEIQTADGQGKAHTAMHGQAVGYLVGRWLGGTTSFAKLLERSGSQLLPVPKGDFGG